MGELKITTTGDKFAATLLYKLAQNQMAELKHSMSYLGLKQNKLEKRPYEGVIISCHSFFGMDTVNIHVEPGAIVNKKDEERYKITEEFFWYAFSTSLLEGNKLIGLAGLRGIDTDRESNVYVVGWTLKNTETNSSSPTVTKYDKDGKFIWRRMTNLTFYETGQSAIKIDNYNGNLIIVYNKYNSERINCFDFCLSQYSKEAILNWQKQITLAITDDIDIYPIGNCIYFDLDYPENNFYVVCGRLYHFDCLLYRAFIIKFNINGEILWQKFVGNYIPGYGEYVSTIEERSHFEKVVSAPEGYTYAIGHHYPIYNGETTRALYPDGLVVKFNSEGNVVWKLSMKGLTIQNDTIANWYDDGVKMTDACLDSDGNLYVIACTHIWEAARCHTNIFKFSSDGTWLWHRVVEMPVSSNYSPTVRPDFSASITASNSSVYVAFCRYPASGIEMGMVLARLNKNNGAPIWQRTLTTIPFTINEINLIGLFPKGLDVRDGCLFIAADIYSEKLQVTIKLPANYIPVGRKGYLNVELSRLIFYPKIDLVPYLEEGGGSGHYTMERRFNDFPLTVTNGNFTIGDAEDGDQDYPYWSYTDKIMRKFLTEKIN